MHYDNSELSSVPVQCLLKPDDLAVPDLPFISLRSGSTDDDHHCAIDRDGSSESEGLLEEQVPRRAIIMIAARYDQVPATEAVESFLCLPILAQ